MIQNKQKKYRTDDAAYKTVSLTLNINVIQAVNEKVEKELDKNCSRFIEETVSSIMRNTKIILNKDRAAYRSFPQKKTFTFSEDFFKEIKKKGNMSFFVESALRKALNIK